jgi:3-dehydroquinate synthase
MTLEPPIIVPLDHNRSYPIYVTSNQLSKFNHYAKGINKEKKVVVLYQPATHQYASLISDTLTQQGVKVFQHEIIEGEQAKSWTVTKTLLDQLFEFNLERQDILIAVGGGVVGDLVGFVASIYLRGISFIQVPTTLLSQVDAAVGGKTGINHDKGKNLIGSFYQPQMVFSDTNTLKTLPPREIRSGLAEVIKYGVIMDTPLFEMIETHIETIKLLDIDAAPELWRTLVTTSCQNKATIVSQDEKESGLRMNLNFGHTIGHAIESVYQYEYTHGECVALGMKAAMQISVHRKWIQLSDYNRLLTLLEKLSFPLSIPKQDHSPFLKRMTHDKKVINGKIRIILPTKIGSVKRVDDITPDELQLALSTLMDENTK